MAKFNYRDYMKNNPLLNEVQGDNDELDDSLGMKHGKKKQTMKQRRADSENMEKAKGKRKYSGDKSKDKVKESYDNVDEEMEKDMKKEEMDPKKKKITVKEFKSQIRERILAEMKDDMDEEMKGDMDEEMKDMDEMRGGTRFEEDDIKAEGLLDFLKKKKEEAPKPKSSSSNEPIGVDYDGNYIYANEGMTEAEEVDVEDDVNIDVDVEDDINIDDVSDKSEIEVDSELAGESSDVSAILGLLTKAQDKAGKMGDEKLLDQIGNTITYYTRAHVVKTS